MNAAIPSSPSPAPPGSIRGLLLGLERMTGMAQDLELVGLAEQPGDKGVPVGEPVHGIHDRVYVIHNCIRNAASFASYSDLV